MQKIQNKPLFRIAEIELDQTILTGSITVTPIKVGKVKVEAPVSGFESSAGEDFATVSFD